MLECLMLFIVFFRFDMPAPTITPEVKKDLEILKVCLIVLFLMYTGPFFRLLIISSYDFEVSFFSLLKMVCNCIESEW